MWILVIFLSFISHFVLVHHQSSFLHRKDIVENDIKSIVPPDIIDNPQSAILIQGVVSEGNLVNITTTMTIDIFKPSNMENI